MKSSTRWLAAVVGGALGFGAIAPEAHAAGAAAPVAFADLPEATVPRLPDVRTAPDRIPPSEQVEGWRFTEAPSPNRAATITSNDSRCFLAAMTSFQRPIPRQPWAILTGMPTVMRSERLVVDGDAARLEIVDGWVDPETRGARLVARSTVPLAKLTEVGGVALYAFRHGDAIDVVAPARTSLRFQDPDEPFGMAMCDHVRSELEAKVGGGESMQATVIVPSPDAPAVPAAAEQALGGAFGRLVRFVVGVSRSTTDPAPLLDVDVAWASDEAVPVSPAELLPQPQVMPMPVPPKQIRSTQRTRMPRPIEPIDLE